MEGGGVAWTGMRNPGDEMNARGNNNNHWGALMLTSLPPSLLPPSRRSTWFPSSRE